tara:strand:- start:84 stop:425 length:342 start_codon:yes stop_codon:yes gene_type:complete
MPFAFPVKKIFEMKNTSCKLVLDLGFKIYIAQTVKLDINNTTDLKALRSLLNKNLSQKKQIMCRVEKNRNKNDSIPFLGYFYDEFGRPIAVPPKKNRYMAKKENPDIFKNLAL